MFTVGFRVGSKDTAPPSSTVVTPSQSIPPVADSAPAETVKVRLPGKIVQIEDTAKAARLRRVVDSLTANNEELHSMLISATARAYTMGRFELPYSDSAGVWGDSLRGRISLWYLPEVRRFGWELAPDPIMIPHTYTVYRPPWWQRPAIAIGGAATALFITKEQYIPAVLTGAGTYLLVEVDF
jgi:hypothetical protein